MRAKLPSVLRHAFLAGGSLVAMMAAVMLPTVAREPDEGHVKAVFSTELPNVPGKRLTAVVVRYAPGEASPPHHHAGSVSAYVLTGAIRSQTSATGPVRIYKAGESFFELPGSRHLISANTSATEPASLLAIFVADDDAVLTTPDQ